MSSQHEEVFTATETTEISASKDEPPAVQMRQNLSRKASIVDAFRNASPGKKEGKWKEISAEDLRTEEMSSTLKHILEDYALSGEVVDGKPESKPKHVAATDAGNAVQLLGGRAFERIHHKIYRAKALTEFSTDNIPEVTASKFPSPPRFPIPELQIKEIKPPRRPLSDVRVLREENLDKAIWKASAVRPSSAFERKLKRIITVGSDSLPQPISMDNTKELSRWPTTSSSHHSQFGPQCAHRETQLMRQKSPNASKVLRDIILSKDRSNLYNEVKDFLLIRLQDLPEGTALSSADYVAVFFEALGLLSDGLTTYKPLLQAITSELKSVFDVQNQCENYRFCCLHFCEKSDFFSDFADVKDKDDCKLAAASIKEKLQLQFQLQLTEMKVALEAQCTAEVEKMRKRVDDMWDKKECSDKKRAELELELQAKSKCCVELSEENAQLKSALQEVIDHNRKIQIVNDDRSVLKMEIRQLHDAVAVMIPKDDVLTWKEKVLEQEGRCTELRRQRDHCKQLLMSMVDETKETMQMALEREHKKAEKLFDGTYAGSELTDFLSIANKELVDLSTTLFRVKALYHKFTSKERVCTWKRKFILDESWAEFLSINDDETPHVTRNTLPFNPAPPSIIRPLTYPVFAMQTQTGHQSSLDQRSQCMCLLFTIIHLFSYSCSLPSKICGQIL